MESKLKIITKWLKNSGLKVNESKTELCLFHRKNTPPVVINVINVNSAIIFDSKLTWATHVPKRISKSYKALHEIKMIEKYFHQSEILSLLTSNFFSILYFISEVWHIPNLNQNLNQFLLSASTNALKISPRNPNCYESFTDIHKSCIR